MQTIPNIDGVEITTHLLLGLLVAIVGWLARGTLRRLDQHIDECNEGRRKSSANEEKLSQLDREMDSVRHDRRWLADSVIRIAAKLDVNLRNRSNNDD